MEVLEGRDGRLTVRHEEHIMAAQEAPLSPVLLRNGHGRSPTAPVMSSGANGLGEHWTATLEPLDSRATDENGDAMITDGVASANQPKATSARKPPFLQKERWKAIQKARRQGMSLRAIERESTGAPPGNTWMPRVLQHDNPGRVPPRHHLIPSRHNRVTFTLNTYADIYPEQRHPSGTFYRRP